MPAGLAPSWPHAPTPDSPCTLAAFVTCSTQASSGPRSAQSTERRWPFENTAPLTPVAKERIIQTPEGSSISLAGRTLAFWDAPGHARHHVFIQDSQTGGIFTGDTFGISYRELDTPKGSFIFVTCPPTQFEPEPLKASIERVIGAQPPAVYLTHYSQVRDVSAAGAQLLRQVDQYVDIAMARRDHGPERAKAIEADLHDLIGGQARQMGVTLDDKTLGNVLALDLRLNADGLSHWLERL